MDDAQEIKRLLDETRHLLAPMGYGNAQITVSAGGAGVWISAFCAGLCFVMMLALLFLYVDQSRKVDDLNHYLQAIYAQAPHLKPEEKD